VGPELLNTLVIAGEVVHCASQGGVTVQGNVQVAATGDLRVITPHTVIGPGFRIDPGGKHATGIVGIQGASGASADKVIATLKTDEHGFKDLLSDQDFTDLANFITSGQTDMDAYIDRASKAPKGDAAKGEAYYNTICANCHGRDGKMPEDMKPFGAQMGNPWEVMHKILNGQPGEDMPALRALDHQIIADIMSHLATLPKE
jgi:thiosulfate dehydrogenase